MHYTGKGETVKETGPEGNGEYRIANSETGREQTAMPIGPKRTIRESSSACDFQTFAGGEHGGEVLRTGAQVGQDHPCAGRDQRGEPR